MSQFHADDSGVAFPMLFMLNAHAWAEEPVIEKQEIERSSAVERGIVGQGGNEEESIKVMTHVKGLLKAILGAVGLELRKKQVKRKSKFETLLETYQVDMIFDIGANIGQSGVWLRSIGFDNPIISFEPISHLFQQLDQRAKSDPKWQVEKLALGEKESACLINVSGGHGGASSILSMTENVIQNAPDQSVVRQEEIAITTVENMMRTYYPKGERLFLKIDVQGYEKHVLDGIGSEWHRVIGLKLEMSLVPNYHGELLLFDMLSLLGKRGFQLVELENGWSNEHTGEMYQVDGVFFRTDRLATSP